MKRPCAARPKPSRYRLLIFLTVLSALISLPLLTSASQQKASIKVNNKSDWDIHHLYLSPHSSDNWGPDQLGKRVLKTGTSYTLTDIPCGEYDIKVVDDDGDECEIENIPMCQDQTVWDLTNKELLSCEGFGD